MTNQLNGRLLEAFGPHLILEGYDCDPMVLACQDTVRLYLEQAPDRLGMTAVMPPVGALLDNGQWMWTTINGAPAGTTIVFTNAVPAGRSIPAGAKVRWFRMKAMANLQ